MKKIIHSLQDALAYQLQGLYYAERKVRDEFHMCNQKLTSSEAIFEIAKYIGAAENKLLKLERVFSYLMQDSVARQNEVINKLIAETHQMMDYTLSPHLKDILVISCIQNINAYKIASYKSAYLFAVELELDTAEDLLQQILEWEIDTGKSLGSLSIREFNKINNNSAAVV